MQSDKIYFTLKNSIGEVSSEHAVRKGIVAEATKAALWHQVGCNGCCTAELCVGVGAALLLIPALQQRSRPADVLCAGLAPRPCHNCSVNQVEEGWEKGKYYCFHFIDGMQEIG